MTRVTGRTGTLPSAWRWEGSREGHLELVGPCGVEGRCDGVPCELASLEEVAWERLWVSCCREASLELGREAQKYGSHRRLERLGRASEIAASMTTDAALSASARLELAGSDAGPAEITRALVDTAVDLIGIGTSDSLARGRALARALKSR